MGGGTDAILTRSPITWNSGIQIVFRDKILSSLLAFQCSYQVIIQWQLQWPWKPVNPSQFFIGYFPSSDQIKHLIQSILIFIRISHFFMHPQGKTSALTAPLFPSLLHSYSLVLFFLNPLRYTPNASQQLILTNNSNHIWRKKNGTVQKEKSFSLRRETRILFYFYFFVCIPKVQQNWSKS